MDTITPHTTQTDTDRRYDAPVGRYLLLREDGGDARLIALDGDVVHLGRGISSGVRLDDHTVSRRHATIVRRGAGMWLLDDRATNGTFLNGTRIDAAPLHDQDVIVVGRAQLTYLEMHHGGVAA